ncbi:MAG TPA: hypothetical protein VMW17_04335 [Candidatus Binatia bacterium]|nr:hypothetical protein [Candidatus Binatia bacterium]
MLIGRMMTAVTVLMALASPALALTLTDQQRITNEDGTTSAIVVTCDANGLLDGHACGNCLMDANFGFRALHSVDLQFIGYLKDANGQPLKAQFVKIVEPNGWVFTTRTSDDGLFRILLGATIDRTSKTPVTKDLGTFTTVAKTGKEGAFSIYVLPEHFKPCAPPKAKKKKK